MLRRINKKNRSELLMFCMFALFSVSPSFAQSQGTPTEEQTQQAPPPSVNSLHPAYVLMPAAPIMGRSLRTSFRVSLLIYQKGVERKT